MSEEPIQNDLASASPERAGRCGPLASLANFFLAHPVGFWFIFWGELAERSSFYGMRTMLGLYMQRSFGFSEQSASMIGQLFNASVYVLPILGGFVADRWLGKYRTIVLFSVPYIVGQLLMTQEGLMQQHVGVLFVALSLLAMGSGVTKPNISPLMGMTYDQQRPGQTELRSQAFNIFYLAINIGSFVSTAALPSVREHYHSFPIAFACPAVLMAVALGFFALGKPFYAVETISRTRPSPDQRREQRVVLGELAGLFLLVAFFWAVYDQQPTTWTFFAQKYTRLSIGSWELPPDQLQAINPFLILVLLPLASVVWQVLARMGMPLRPTDKMFVGFVFTIVAMGCMAAGGFSASAEAKVSVWWEIWAYVFITAAEVCISPVGLELAFAAAPTSMKGFVTACWLAMVFLGNLLGAAIDLLYDKWLGPGGYFMAQMLMIVAVTASFLWVARRFNRPAAKVNGEW